MAGGPVFLALEVGDWATWVSGIGSLLAVATSLYLARRASNEATASRMKMEGSLVRILSAQAQKPIVQVASSLGVVRDAIERLQQGKVYGKPEVMFKVRGQESLGALVQRAHEVDGIPLGVVEAVVTLDLAISTYNGAVEATLPMIADIDRNDGEHAADEGAELCKFLLQPFNDVEEATRSAVDILGAHSRKIADMGKLWGVSGG